MLKPSPRVSSITAWKNQSKEPLRMLSENTIEIGSRAESATGYLNSVRSRRRTALSYWNRSLWRSFFHLFQVVEIVFYCRGASLRSIDDGKVLTALWFDRNLWPVYLIALAPPRPSVLASQRVTQTRLEFYTLLTNSSENRKFCPFRTSQIRHTAATTT